MQDDYASRTEQAINDFHRIRERTKEMRDKARAIKNERLECFRIKIIRAKELLEVRNYSTCKAL